jgi:hypothetical protein
MSNGESLCFVHMPAQYLSESRYNFKLITISLFVFPNTIMGVFVSGEVLLLLLGTSEGEVAIFTVYFYNVLHSYICKCVPLYGMYVHTSNIPQYFEWVVVLL